MRFLSRLKKASRHVVATCLFRTDAKWLLTLHVTQTLQYHTAILRVATREFGFIHWYYDLLYLSLARLSGYQILQTKNSQRQYFFYELSRTFRYQGLLYSRACFSHVFLSSDQREVWRSGSKVSWVDFQVYEIPLYTIQGLFVCRLVALQWKNTAIVIRIDVLVRHPRTSLRVIPWRHLSLSLSVW